ncbi:MAG: hypothetical protein FWC32_01035 [Firmicutes bacterium]|nr:hypothetical protein [Bacillota bacterium]
MKARKLQAALWLLPLLLLLLSGCGSNNETIEAQSRLIYELQHVVQHYGTIIAGLQQEAEANAATIYELRQAKDYYSTTIANHDTERLALRQQVAEITEQLESANRFIERFIPDLCGCGLYPAYYVLPPPTPPLNILSRDIDDEFLSTFETVHTFTYQQWETDWYGTIILWPDEPLRDFAFLSILFDEDDDGMFFTVREELLTIDELLPSHAVVLNVAFIHYLIPRGGITFTDANGVQRRMFITDVSVRGGCFPYFILAPHDETHWADWR